MKRPAFFIFVAILLGLTNASLGQSAGALFTGNIADACTTSAMGAGILTAMRDKHTGREEALAKVAELLARDPNKEFHLALAEQNAAVVYAFSDIPKALHEQVALARCARFAKGKPTLTNDAVAPLMGAVSKCQVSDSSDPRKCAFAVVFEASSP